MKHDVNKKALIAAVKDLLEQSDAPERITSRAIAERAGVNAAMINYYFKSKDQLLTIAVGEIIAASAELFRHAPDQALSPKERLRAALWSLSETVIRFHRYSKIYVPQILLESGIDAPLYLLPDVRQHFHGRKSESECRVIAYQLVSFLQLVFYRADEFFKYSGIDLKNQEERRKLLDEELDIFLPEAGKT
jgi:TetR/AcrR family transcriptional regulator, regulator of cefoperazone and chloramphenicol sensitivity